MITLEGLLGRLRGVVVEQRSGPGTAEINAITHDSRRAGPGTAFVAIPGERTDGHLHAPAAVAAGSPLIVTERRLDIAHRANDRLVVDQLVVANTRQAAGPIAAAVHGHPSDSLPIAGVTGTNGKTTTTQLLAAILRADGRPTEVLGTLSGGHTTPEAPDLQARLARMLHEGAQAAAIEVSSHALALHRVDGTRFAVAVFTNLSRDHLDLHGSHEAYLAAKARLFTSEFTDRAVINLDDEAGRRIAVAASGIEIIGYSLDDIDDVDFDALSHRYRWRGQQIDVPIGGSFNVENSLAAATSAAVLGVPLEAIAAGLRHAPPVRGRFEPVPNDRGIAAIIDYAHTPDGLDAALRSARRAVGRGRVIVVFGCGGDRDHGKRPQMGAVAATLADLVVVTSDNPRSENPESIVASILEGVPAGYRDRVTVDVDRRAAIGAALGLARAGDVVLVAGKGHETTQTIGTRVLPFDDRDVVREFLEHTA